MSLTNMTRIEQILDEPDPNATLDDLKAELNELAKLRERSRVAFCRRLAIVYLTLVGRPMTREAPRDNGSEKFYLWCRKNLRSANGKEYSTTTLRKYVAVGFSGNPVTALKELRASANRISEVARKLGSALIKNVKEEQATKVVPIVKLRERLPNDVAREVNNLMRAWEQASSEARAQFLYHVTGRKISAA